MGAKIEATADRGRDRYLELVREFPLRPIRSEGELDAAIGMIDSLSDLDEMGAAERDYLFVLAKLIHDYEEDRHPRPPVSGADMLRHLIEAKRVNQARVAHDTGISESTLSEILAGKRGPSRKVVTALAGYFHVNPGVFL